MIQKGSIVRALILYKDVKGRTYESEFKYGIVHEINEFYEPSHLIEIALPNKEGESFQFYRFWSSKEDLTLIANPNKSEVQ